ncbi:MAG: GNAT family N-acetyltransferase [Deinococcales bacterium]
MPLLIRDAGPRDAAAIASIARRGWSTGYRGLLEASFLDRRAASDQETEWRSYLADRPDDHGILVADSDGTVVGFVRFGPTVDSDRAREADGEVYGFYVAPERTGEGLGRRLFAAARERLAAMGHRHLVLWTFEGNRAAERFYARAGLAPDGARRAESESGAPERRWRGSV